MTGVCSNCARRSDLLSRLDRLCPACEWACRVTEPVAPSRVLLHCLAGLLLIVAVMTVVWTFGPHLT